MPWMRFRAPIFALLSTLIACASAPPLPTPSGPPRATLEVVNRTGLDWNISLAGWSLGRVGPGTRRAFRDLRPGVWRLRAERKAYTDKAFEVTTAAGGAAIWEILPPQHLNPLPAPSAFGSLRIDNPTRRDLTVRIDDSETIRALLAGDSRILTDIPTGERTLHLQVPGTRYHRAVPVLIEGTKQTRINAPVEVGSVKVTNTTGESVRVMVDGIRVAQLADGRTETVDDLLVGVHKLRAVGSETRKEHLRQVNIDLSQTIDWDLTARAGKLLLLNKTGETLTIMVDGEARGTLAPRKELAVADVALGLRLVTALGDKSAYRWTAELPLVAGHVLTWTLRPDAATLRVHNSLSEPMVLRLGKRDLGTVPSGQAVFFDDLPAGNQTFAAFGEQSGVALKASFDLTPLASAHWRIDAPEGRVHVRNKTAEPVVVYADQRPLGRVEPNAELIYTQVPPGARLMEARGTLSGEVTRGKLEVEAAAIVVWDVARSAGIIKVENRSGELLLAPPTLAPQAATVADGASASYQVPTGHRTIHLIGKTSGQSYHRRVQVGPDETREWLVKPLMGILHVFNRTREKQVLTLGDQTIELGPRKDQKLSLRAGNHRLVAVGQTTHGATEGTVVVRPDVSQSWEIRPELAHVRVENQTTETVDLRRGKEILGFVEPGAMRTFGPWPPGVRELTAQGRWSRAIYQVELDMPAGRVESWAIQPARGAVLVSNRRDEPVRVMVDRVEVSIVAANEQARVEMALGKHYVELIGASSHAHFGYKLRLRPDRTYSVEAPVGPAELHVVNKLGLALTIRVDRIDLGVVEPNSETRIALKRGGEMTVHAVSPDGRLTWQRRIDVRDDRSVTWEIRP